MEVKNYFVIAQFINKNEDDNILLKETLNNSHFKSTIISNNNILYKLPDTMYRFDSKSEIENILEDVKNIVYKIDNNELNSTIIVTESKGSQWANLDFITE